ncbi:MAG TPA: zinc ABC transporter substrate-binding protein [Candidatus Saccharimonadales bacterium]|nr:zinc ABC transporter substrate-binding protein [Candidatus Saccharimonadales bacterium]
MKFRGPALGALVLLAVPLLASCARVGPHQVSGTGRLVVVAAENFWGSIAAQLGGERVTVTSIVTDPNADPHEHEASPADARLLASANYVIVNGAGYDTWADQLLAAQPESTRTVLTVATLLGRRSGDNPHFWYDPASVARVVARITADYTALNPDAAAYFNEQAVAFAQALTPYHERLANIRARFAGTPIAATESLFQYMARYLGLDLITPYAFMQAVAEGNDPPSPALVMFTQQIQKKAFVVLVFNSQTITPLTTSLEDQTAAAHLRTVAVTETLAPQTATFQAWMDAELDALSSALAAGRSA